MNPNDMREAIRMIAADRGLSVDALLQVLVEALYGGKEGVRS